MCTWAQKVSHVCTPFTCAHTCIGGGGTHLVMMGAPWGEPMMLWKWQPCGPNKMNAATIFLALMHAWMRACIGNPVTMINPCAASFLSNLVYDNNHKIIWTHNYSYQVINQNCLCVHSIPPMDVMHIFLCTKCPGKTHLRLQKQNGFGWFLHILWLCGNIIISDFVVTDDAYRRCTRG